MKKFILLFTVLFILSLPAYAQRSAGNSFAFELKQTIHLTQEAKNDADSYRLLLMQGQKPKSGFDADPSVWDTVSNYFTGDEKKEKQKAIAAYLFNMYAANALNNKTNPPAVLDLKYTGVLDPVYPLLAREKPADILKFYDKNKTEIKKELAALVNNNLLLPYSTTNIQNDKFEKVFIGILPNNKNNGGHYGYAPLNNTAGEVPVDNALSQDLISALKNTEQMNKRNNEKKVSLYRQIDMMKAIDNANSLGGKSRSSMETYYRSVNDECAVCTYTLCQYVCANLNRQYAQWQIYKIYNISAYNTNSKYVLTNQNADRFKSPSGQEYPQWDYHTASLILLKKDNKIVPVVVDSFLLEEPAPLQEWAALFSQKDTIFKALPFTRKAAVEKDIIDKSKLPSGAKPYAVRK